MSLATLNAGILFVTHVALRVGPRQCKCCRLTQFLGWLTTDCGQTLLARVVLSEALRRALGDPTDNPVAMGHAIMREGRTIALAEGARIRRRKIAGQWRCEIEDAPRAMSAALKSAGCSVELIAHTPRVFVPIDDAPRDPAVGTLGAVLQALRPAGDRSGG